MKVAVSKALSLRPTSLLPIEEALRAPPPRRNLTTDWSYWEPSLREGVPVQGWVFHSTVDESDPERHHYVEYAIEILQESSRQDPDGVRQLLAPFAASYTQRALDPFYIVADLYAYARQGGDVLTILERIAPKLPYATKPYWAAE